MGLMDPASLAAAQDNGLGGRVLLVDDRPSSSDRLIGSLQSVHTVELETNPQQAMLRAPKGNFDVVIVSLGLANYDGLRLCSQLRSLERTRRVPILIVSDPEEQQRVLRGLEIGVNDYLSRPVDRNEMLARVRTQVRRKRYLDSLSQTVTMSMEAAVVDQLTGLSNRRFMQTQLTAMASEGASNGKPFAVMILDIDHFKQVNDSFGHHAGDEVLLEFAQRIKKSIRGIDMACRSGGEEFVVLLPETDPAIAGKVAERIRQKVERQPFPINGGRRVINVTVSIGVAGFVYGHTTADAMLKRADNALYRAKRSGRNRVIEAAA
jgi:two-component system cell cycle response regulator